MPRYSPAQTFAMSCLALGPLKYTVAGYAAATQSNAGMGANYVSAQTMDSLVRRGFARVSAVHGRRNRRAYITAAGRRLLEA